MISLLIYLLVVCIIIGLVWWIVDYVPVPHPLNRLIKIVSMVIGVIIVIYVLIAISGGAGVNLPRLQ